MFIQKATYNASKNKDGGRNSHDFQFCRISRGHRRFSRELKVLHHENEPRENAAFQEIYRAGAEGVENSSNLSAVVSRPGAWQRSEADVYRAKTPLTYKSNCALNDGRGK